MTETLRQKHCIPCETGTSPLTEQQIRALMTDVPGWEVIDGKIVRDVKVKNFKTAVNLVNQIAAVAEEENHHPDIQIHGWNHVLIELSTHNIGGLSENDAIMAAKLTGLIDRAETG